MEILPLIFVVALFMSLVIEKKEKTSKSSGDKLADGILAIAKDVKKALKE